MTEYVLLHPADDEILLVPALVDRPVLVPKTDAARTVKRLALERQLAELDAEEGRVPGLSNVSVAFVDDYPAARLPDEPGPRYAGTYVGADGVARTELHFTEKKPGPGHVCECGQAFYDRSAYLLHGRSCGIHVQVVADPRYEKDAFMHGSTEKHPLR